MGVLSNNPITYVEGSTNAIDLITSISNEVTEAQIAGQSSTWEQVFYQEPVKWATFTPNYTPNYQGKVEYEGVTYDVQQMNDISGWYGQTTINSNVVTVGYNQPSGEITGLVANPYPQAPTSSVIVSDTTKLPPFNGLFIIVPDPTDPTGAAKMAVGVTQNRDSQWDDFEIMTDSSANPVKYVLPPLTVNLTASYNGSNYTWSFGKSSQSYQNYTFTKRFYTNSDPINSFPATVVLRCGATSVSPATPIANDDATFVMLQQVVDNYNYVDVFYGQGFSGTNSVGDTGWTFNAFDPNDAPYLPTKTYAVADQGKADDIYQLQTNPPSTPLFTAPTLAWEKDSYTGYPKVSPAYHWFYAKDNEDTWMPTEYRRRRPDWSVNYAISMNNTHLAIVIQGDPSPDFNGYYTSFAYVGEIVPFSDADTDYKNFGVTVGMAECSTASGFALSAIDVTANPDISKFGKYASNGVTSMSMMGTVSGVPFQAYYPAFVTQMPDYTGQSPIPKGAVPSFPTGSLPLFLTSHGINDDLVLTQDGFQQSAWTKEYHGSPVYLVHPFEGFRGWLDGVVAIDKANLISEDELIVTLDDGTQETYKFFTVTTPISFLKKSANPISTTVAIRKA